MILFLLIMIITFSLGFFLPWWVLIPVVFLLCLWRTTNIKSAFSIPFASIFVLWLLLIIYYSMGNGHILSKRIAELFGLGDSSFSWLWIILLSPIPGAITAGLAGVSGFLTKQFLFKNRPEFTKLTKRAE